MNKRQSFFCLRCGIKVIAPKELYFKSELCGECEDKKNYEISIIQKMIQTLSKEELSELCDMMDDGKFDDYVKIFLEEDSKNNPDKYVDYYPIDKEEKL